MKQYESLRFLTDANGQRRKIDSLNFLSGRGWRIVSETVEPGHMKGGDACCLALICLPLGFAAGRTPNITVVSLERDAVDAVIDTEHLDHAWRRLDDNRAICAFCEAVEENPVR